MSRKATSAPSLQGKLSRKATLAYDRRLEVEFAHRAFVAAHMAGPCVR